MRRSIADLADIAAEASTREIAEAHVSASRGISFSPPPEQGETGEALTESATRQMPCCATSSSMHSDCGCRLDDAPGHGPDSADQVLIVATPDAHGLLRPRRRLTDARRARTYHLGWKRRARKTNQDSLY